MPTIYQQTIRPNGGCFAEDTTGGAASVVGASPQWGDQSDTTYCAIPSRLSGGGNTAERSTAFAQMASATFPWSTFTASVRLRLRSSATLPHPDVFMRRGNGTIVYQNVGSGGSNPVGSPAWIELPLTEVAAGFAAELAAGSLQVLIRSPFAFSAGPDGTYTTTIYEVELLLDKVVISSTSPPCRNIKRGDRLDLGGARNYPPSKMQQTSSRGVGAY